MAAKFRKKPIEIEAVQLTWANWSEVCEFIGEGTLTDAPGGPHAAMSDECSDPCGEGVDGKFIVLYLFTMHGDLTTFRHGDWIIPDGKPGTFYPCKPEIFAATYEPVE